MVMKDVLKVEYNDPHKFAMKLRGFSFTFDSHKWPTVFS